MDVVDALQNSRKTSPKTVEANASTSYHQVDVSPKPVLSLTILTTMLMVFMLDRQILGILIEPIKRELLLSDTQLGLLTGLAFSAMYVVLAVPVAAFADRGDRPKIIAVAAAVWSAMTVVCGFASSFVMLALARMGVAIGESGCLPASYSLVAGVYPANRRATANAIHHLGNPLGVFLAFLMGGYVAEHFGWRAAFWVASVPGFILAVVTWFLLPEVRRLQPVSPDAQKRLSMAIFFDMLKQLMANPMWRAITLAEVMGKFASYGLTAWIASMFLREYKWSLGGTGETLGIIIAVTGILSAFAGGIFTDRRMRSDRAAQASVATVLVWITTIFFALMLVVKNAYAAAILYAVTRMFSEGFQPGSNAALQTLVPANRRASSTALSLVFSNLIGFGFGPLAVGMLSDYFTKTMGPSGLRFALFAPVVAYAFCAMAYHYAARLIRKSPNAILS